MKLNELLANIKYEILQGDVSLEISSVVYDSRKVKEDSLFVCMSGFSSDGHGYITRAHELGARAVIVEKDLDACNEALLKKANEDGFGDLYVPFSMTVIKVDNTREALALISAKWFDYPAKKMTLIGLTGTKGKTTTAHMVKKIIEAGGNKTAMIGTIGAFIGEEKIETKNTTPESFELHKLFAQMVEKGCTHCVMEVSSQALKMGRVHGIDFDYAAFLNLSSDHIGPGEHPDFDDYFECKKKIFDHTENVILNIDSEHVAKCINLAKDKCENVYTISTKTDASLQAVKLEDIWEPDILGSRIETKGLLDNDFIIPMPGRFNAENALIALAICSLCGINEEALKKGLLNTTVKGRTQVVREASHIATFIIDYAHNALSTESLLSMLKGYNPNHLICLFGGGGNKPKQRRYDMGEACAKYADLIVLTEDNPRFEEIDDINNDIIVGINVHDGKYDIIKDRKEAIEHLMDIARPGDIIALIGKGHETYQDVKGVKTYFCEEEIIKDYVVKKRN